MTSRRLTLLALAACIAAATVMVGACSSSPEGGVAGVGPDGPDSSIVTDGDPPEAATTDAPGDAPSATCEGACKTTLLVADFGGKMRTLARAQFGTQAGDGGTELHTESHMGGSAACPGQGSPTPDYTLIVTAIARGASGTKLSDRDRVTSAFFDFKGDLGLAAPSGITKAITVNVTVVAEDPSSPPKWVALDVSAGFREGDVKGHLYAEYCQSLSE